MFSNKYTFAMDVICHMICYIPTNVRIILPYQSLFPRYKIEWYGECPTVYDQLSQTVCLCCMGYAQLLRSFWRLGIPSLEKDPTSPNTGIPHTPPPSPIVSNPRCQKNTSRMKSKKGWMWTICKSNVSLWVVKNVNSYIVLILVLVRNSSLCSGTWSHNTVSASCIAFS